jgi:hypothetical protein
MCYCRLMKTRAIYGLCINPGDIVYVGLTRVGPESRLKKHISNAASGRPGKVWDWIREVGPENVHVVTLQTCDNPDDLGLLEEAWIAQLRAVGQAALNVTHGGWRGKGRVWTDEEKAAQSERLKQFHAAHPEAGTTHSERLVKDWEDDEKRAAQAELKRKQYKRDPSIAKRQGESLRRFYALNGPPTIAATPESHRKGGIAATHKRWHANRGVLSKECSLCA